MLNLKDSLRILVLGSTGMLGSTLVPFLRESGYSVYTHCNKNPNDFSFQGDLIFPDQVDYVMNRVCPDIVINLIALTSVEMCETNIPLAFKLNAIVVDNIAQNIEKINKNIYLIQLSTDQLYDGDGPHSEDSVKVSNIYSATKYAGEIAALRVNSSILRTNFVGKSKSASRESLTDWVIKSQLSHENVYVLNDVYFSPLSMSNLSNMIKLVIEKKPNGIFNIGSRDGMSKAEFDIKFAKKMGFGAKNMIPIKLEDATFLTAYRPRDMRLCVSKFEVEFGLIMPSLEDEIESLVKEYIRE